MVRWGVARACSNLGVSALVPRAGGIEIIQTTWSGALRDFYKSRFFMAYIRLGLQSGLAKNNEIRIICKIIVSM